MGPAALRVRARTLGMCWQLAGKRLRSRRKSVQLGRRDRFLELRKCHWSREASGFCRLSHATRKQIGGQDSRQVAVDVDHVQGVIIAVAFGTARQERAAKALPIGCVSDYDRSCSQLLDLQVQIVSLLAACLASHKSEQRARTEGTLGQLPRKMHDRFPHVRVNLSEPSAGETHRKPVNAGGRLALEYSESLPSCLPTRPPRCSP